MIFSEPIRKVQTDSRVVASEGLANRKTASCANLCLKFWLSLDKLIIKFKTWLTHLRMLSSPTKTTNLMRKSSMRVLLPSWPKPWSQIARSLLTAGTIAKFWRVSRLLTATWTWCSNKLVRCGLKCQKVQALETLARASGQRHKTKSGTSRRCFCAGTQSSSLSRTQSDENQRPRQPGSP